MKALLRRADRGAGERRLRG